MNRRISTVAICAGLCICSPLIAEHTIEELAPESTFLIFGAKNLNQTIERCKNTGIWTLWQSPEMKELRADALEKFADELNEMFEELGVEEDSLTPPTGAAGLAISTVRDEELGTLKPAILLFADYGENADKTSALITAALEKGVDEDALELDEAEALGRTITVVSELKDDDDFGNDEFEEFNMNPMPDPSEMFGDMDKFYFVREGNSFIASTELGCIADALETIDGGDRKSLSARSEFQSIMTNVGNVDFYGVLLTKDLTELVVANDPMGMVMMMVPTLKTAFGDIKGFGCGFRLNGSKAMVEETFAVYMPNGKQGLTKLIDNPVPRATLPSFVSSDTISYGTFQFNFAGLMNVVRQVVMSNPMMAMEGQQMIDAIEMQINPVTATLGSTIHTTSTTSKPITATSGGGVLALECTKPQEFENFFGSIAAQWGIESRDFLGNRIYTMNLAEMMGGMMPPGVMGMPMDSLSLGLGSGHLFLGPTPSVEQSLRAGGNAKPSGLKSVPDYARAIATLGNENVIGWGYSNTWDSLEMTLVSQKAAMNEMIEQMREWDPEMAAEQEAEMKSGMAFFDSIDFDLMREHIGPSVWQIRSTNDGFIADVYILSAPGQN